MGEKEEKKEKLYNHKDEEVSRVEDLDLSREYSYGDYLKWKFEERVVFFLGWFFFLCAPNRWHQHLSIRIASELHVFLKGRSCEVFSAPFDVRLPRKSTEDREIFTVVQPDVCVVCDPANLDFKGCLGAPDIMVEILSPGNNRKEMRNKFEVYEESGVKEYWVVVPGEKIFLQYMLDRDGKYVQTQPLTSGDKVTTPILPGFELDLEELFKQLP